MAGDAHVDKSQFKGLSKYFNSQTMKGRANVAKATYAGIALLTLYMVTGRKKKAEPTPKK
ncbi:ATP synthase F(0) complex subunit k, mitochondrial-like [Tachypleus tridentatus]|uniref:ATP synthase F(0) complex subunit k, mitochondrial-like n=1 Tax=Tachypleus tridentatus TaxID=6853 RepID=UPI003FD368F7